MHVAPTPVPAAPLAASLAVTARRLAGPLASGAMLWTAAPGLEDHARHLALEFLHPAAVGAPAFPAVAVAAPDPVAFLRTRVRPGDVVVTLGRADSGFARSCSVRSRAWGAVHIHIGPGSAHQLDPVTTTLALGSPDRADRLMIRCYHLLWELTAIAMGEAHPARPHLTADAAPGCAVCSDEAIVGEIEALDASSGAAVRTACGSRSVDVSLLGPVSIHDVVLVHGGVAIGKLLDAAGIGP